MSLIAGMNDVIEYIKKIEEENKKLKEDYKNYGVMVVDELGDEDVGYYDTLEEAKLEFKLLIEELPNCRIVIFLTEDYNVKHDNWDNNIIEQYNNLPPEDVNFNPEDIGYYD